MVCRLTVLIALLAQGIALMSPACFVRCVAANGHECVELVGQDCLGCKHGLSDHDHSLPTCCSDCSEPRHSDDDDKNGTAVTSREHCGCSHSPLDFGPQASAKSLTAERLLDEVSMVFASLPILPGRLVMERHDDFSPPLLRRQVSLHLTVLATVVLRA